MPFDQIVGQDRPLNVVRSMLRSGRVPHAFLFTGPAGIGKRTTALALARALNCTKLKADFCGACASCRKTETGVHPDIIEIGPEKNIIKIERIRNLQQNIVFAPMEGAWRAVIIDQAETMSREAANCLLKTLEEPPPATVLVLVAHCAGRLLSTVRSRCQTIVFSPLAGHDLQSLLEREGTPRDKAIAVMTHAHGSMHRARLLLDNSILEDFNRLTTILCMHGTLEQRFELASALSKSPDRIPTIMLLLLGWLRDVLLYRLGAHGARPSCAAHPEQLTLAACRLDPFRLSNKIAQAARLMNDQTRNINIQLGLESLLLS